MTDLAEWLLAQIAEDEACADLCARCGHSPLDHLDANPGRRECVRPPGCICPDFLPAGVFNPDYVKALCVARRRIVELHRRATFTDVSLDIRDADVCLICHCILDEPDDWPADREWSYPLVQDAWPCQTLRLLALPYADHDGYRETWRPD